MKTKLLLSLILTFIVMMMTSFRMNEMNTIICVCKTHFIRSTIIYDNNHNEISAIYNKFNVGKRRLNKFTDAMTSSYGESALYAIHYHIGEEIIFNGYDTPSGIMQIMYEGERNHLTLIIYNTKYCHKISWYKEHEPI